MNFSGLPIGFSMNLAENEVALNAFNALAEAQKQAVIARAKEAQTVEEMHQLVASLTAKVDFL